VVPSKASGAVLNTLAPVVDDMDGAALDTRGIGCWTVVQAGCFPLDVDTVGGGFWGVSGSAPGRVDGVASGVSFAAVHSRVW